LPSCTRPFAPFLTAICLCPAFRLVSDCDLPVPSLFMSGNLRDAHTPGAGRDGSVAPLSGCRLREAGRSVQLPAPAHPPGPITGALRLGFSLCHAQPPPPPPLQGCGGDWIVPRESATRAPLQSLLWTHTEMGGAAMGVMYVMPRGTAALGGQRGWAAAAAARPVRGDGGASLLPRVQWVAVPEALRPRRVNRTRWRATRLWRRSSTARWVRGCWTPW
jgi:hypothetical protein